MKDSLRRQVRDAFEGELEAHDPQLRARVVAAVSARPDSARQRVWHWAIGLSGLLLVGLVAGTIAIAPRLVGRPSPGPVAPEPTPSASATALPAEPIRITTIRMFTPEVGWAATGQQVFRTLDGGAHWSNVTPDDARPAPRASSLGIGVAFGGTEQAWLVEAASTQGSRVFRTSDGGKTWQASAPVPAGLWAIQLAFIDSQHGWLLVHLDAAMQKELVRLLQSSDGGAHWTEVASANVVENQPTGSISIGCQKTGVTFIDSSTGWLTGNCSVGPPFLYVSHDGGKNWRRQSLPPPSNPSIQLVGDTSVSPPTFVSPRDGVLPVGLSSHVFYATHDGGETWLPTAPWEAPPVIAIVNASRWIAVLRDRLFVTEDGGKTWTPQSTNVPAEGVEALNFVNDKVGWARGTKSRSAPGRSSTSFLLKTIDGGRTWTDQTLPGM